MTANNIAGSSALNSSSSVRLNYVVTTLAGGGTYGLVNDTGTNALFNGPWGVAVNNSGDVIVADTANNCIRKVTNPGGVVTTLAGSVTGTSGFVDGTGAGASFNTPYGVTMDRNNNAIVADTVNGYIRKVTSAGAVTTLPGEIIMLSVMNVAVDANGNIIYSEYNAHRIRKLTPSGAVTTLVGSGTAGFAIGTGTGAVINKPWGVTIDNDGNIIFSDSGNYRIRKINITTLEVTTLAGSGNSAHVDGTGDTASFSIPAGLAIDNNGDVIVADYYGSSIRKVTNPGGVVTTLVGSGTFTYPLSVAIDTEGKIIVADSLNHRICKIY
jgi:streptogramin lyase